MAIGRKNSEAGFRRKKNRKQKKKRERNRKKKKSSLVTFLCVFFLRPQQCRFKPHRVGGESEALRLAPSPHLFRFSILVKLHTYTHYQHNRLHTFYISFQYFLDLFLSILFIDVWLFTTTKKEIQFDININGFTYIKVHVKIYMCPHTIITFLKILILW